MLHEFHLNLLDISTFVEQCNNRWKLDYERKAKFPRNLESSFAGDDNPVFVAKSKNSFRAYFV